jgi:hypothetical protein
MESGTKWILMYYKGMVREQAVSLETKHIVQLPRGKHTHISMHRLFLGIGMVQGHVVACIYVKVLRSGLFLWRIFRKGKE